jgi:hypothetical protein
MPLVEPLRTEAWNVPMDHWEQYIDLPKTFR